MFVCVCGWESFELRTEGVWVTVFGLGCVSVCVHVVSNIQVHLCACVFVEDTVSVSGDSIFQED